jgi:hypothetical protein
MITIFAAEQRDGRITMATDRDCLPADVIRTSTRVFPDYDSILETAEMYFNRGFSVCVDTERGVVEYEQ